MASVCVLSGALIGLEAVLIEVEVDTTPGLFYFSIVGLPDKGVEESKERIGSAIRNSGFTGPKQTNRRIIVNLAPAAIKKQGSAYDLPIAVGYLLSTQQLRFDCSGKMFLGELALNGNIRSINGALSLVMLARDLGIQEVYIPDSNVQEVEVITGVRIVPVRCLRELTDHLLGHKILDLVKSVEYGQLAKTFGRLDGHVAAVDMAEIKGQESAKRSILVAAAGGHNILMHGPPGSGKTMLARAIQSILPDMSYQEALEVTKIYSADGRMEQKNIITQRPFRNPHHLSSSVAVIGGGTPPHPGEISFAHRGVLFLDEFPEFPRSVIEALREPMESGKVIISRALGTFEFPSRFILVAAMNPCPCGNYGNDTQPCICTGVAVAKYQRKISGPILDRIDLQIKVPRETFEKISAYSKSGTSSEEFRIKVADIRALQQKRYQDQRFTLNSEIPSKLIPVYCTMTIHAQELIKKIVVRGNLSGRGYHKIVKVARTIADLEGMQTIESQHIAEAASYRIALEEG